MSLKKDNGEYFTEFDYNTLFLDLVESFKCANLNKFIDYDEEILSRINDFEFMILSVMEIKQKQVYHNRKVTKKRHKKQVYHNFR